MVNTSKTSWTKKLQAKLEAIEAEQRQHRGPELAKQDFLSVIDCEKCGFAHLRGGWMPAEAYVAGQLPDLEWYQKERREVAAGWWDACFQAQLDLLRLTPGHALLDVGAGFGFFVNWARERGWRVDGNEVSRLALERAPLLYRRGEEPGDRYWALRYNLVLEHLEDPRATLAADIQRWQPSRLLLIVPNELNPAQRAVGGTWWISPWHRNYFTPASLIRLAESLGLALVYQTASYPMEWFITMGLDYRGRPEVGRLAHHIRLWREMQRGPRIFQEEYHDWHMEWGVGRELIYVFERRLPEAGRQVVDNEEAI